MLADLELKVVARGAAMALVLGAPAAVANIFLADADPKPKAGLFATFLLVLLGAVLGGRLAGRESLDLPTKHAAAAGFVAFVVVQALGTLGRISRGDAVSPIGIVLNGVLIVSAAMLGGLAGARNPRRP